jgi:hypothetical protein
MRYNRRILNYLRLKLLLALVGLFLWYIEAYIAKNLLF